MTSHKLGWIPDPPKRPGQKADFDADEVLRALPAPPPSASLRAHVVEILNQTNNDCVANMGMQLLRISHHRQGAERPELGSRRFGYKAARSYHGADEVDEGTYLRTFFQAMIKFGFPPESAWPYSLDVNAPLTMASFRAAADQRSTPVYRKIYDEGDDRLRAIKYAVAGGFAVGFGTDISQRFFDWRGSDKALGPPLGELILGGHAIGIVGYDNDDYDVVNSHGAGFGDGGYIRFSGAYLKSARTRDLWIVEAAPPFSR